MPLKIRFPEFHASIECPLECLLDLLVSQIRPSRKSMNGVWIEVKLVRWLVALLCPLFLHFLGIRSREDRIFFCAVEQDGVLDGGDIGLADEGRVIGHTDVDVVGRVESDDELAAVAEAHATEASIAIRGFELVDPLLHDWNLPIWEVAKEEGRGSSKSKASLDLGED